MLLGYVGKTMAYVLKEVRLDDLLVPSGFKIHKSMFQFAAVSQASTAVCQKNTAGPAFLLYPLMKLQTISAVGTLFLMLFCKLVARIILVFGARLFGGEGQNSLVWVRGRLVC